MPPKQKVNRVPDVTLLLNTGGLDYSFELALAELLDNAIQGIRVPRIPCLCWL